MVSFGFLLASLVIKCFRKYKVNYEHIFDIKSGVMNEYNFYKFSMILSSMTLVAFSFEMCLIKGYIGDEKNIENLPSLLLISMIFIMLVFPLQVFNRSFRFELLYVILRNILAPFFDVRFRDFFFGDILTSLVGTL